MWLFRFRSGSRTTPWLWAWMNECSKHNWTNFSQQFQISFQSLLFLSSLKYFCSYGKLFCVVPPSLCRRHWIIRVWDNDLSSFKELKCWMLWKDLVSNEGKTETKHSGFSESTSLDHNHLGSVFVRLGRVLSRHDSINSKWSHHFWKHPFLGKHLFISDTVF